MRRLTTFIITFGVLLASFLTPFAVGAPAPAYAQTTAAPAGGEDPCDPCANLRRQLAEAEAELAANLARQEELGHQLNTMRAELEHRRAHILTGYRHRSDPNRGLLTDNPGSVDASEWEQIWQSESDLAAIAALEAAIAAAEAELAALQARAEELRGLIDDLRRQLEDCERRAREERENRCPDGSGDGGSGDGCSGDGCSGDGCSGDGCSGDGGSGDGGSGGSPDGSGDGCSGDGCSGGSPDGSGGGSSGGTAPAGPGSGATDGGNSGGSDSGEDPCDPCADLRKQLAEAEAELAANLAAQDQLRGMLAAMRARLAEMQAHVLHGYRSTTDPNHGLLTDRPEGVDPNQWEEIWQQQADQQGIAQLQEDIAEAEAELAGLEAEAGEIQRRIDDLRRRLEECEKEAAKRKAEECDPKGGLPDWLIDFINWLIDLFRSDGVEGVKPPELPDFSDRGWMVEPLPTELVRLDLVSALPPVGAPEDYQYDGMDRVVREDRDPDEPATQPTVDNDNHVVEQPKRVTTTTQPHHDEPPVWQPPVNDQPVNDQPVNDQPVNDGQTDPRTGNDHGDQKPDGGVAVR